jgi:integrase
MATIRKRVDSTGRVRWQTMIRRTGQPAIVRTFSTHKEATAWAGDLERDRRHGKAPTAGAYSTTFKEIVPHYLKSNRHLRSITKVERVLNQWSAMIGHLTLDKITRATIARHKDELTGSPGTRNLKLAILSAFFTWIIKDRALLTINPVANVRRPPLPPDRVRYLSADERESLFSACKESANPDLHAIVVIATYTGMRQQEIMRLTWSNIDLANRSALLPDTKNGTPRRVPLAAPVIEAIRGRVRRLGEDRIFPMLFPRTAWETARRRAGLVDFRFHDCRHSAASYLAMSGADLLEIATILGHKQLTMVRRYAHLSPSHLVGVADRMAAKFS